MKISSTEFGYSGKNFKKRIDKYRKIGKLNYMFQNTNTIIKGQQFTVNDPNITYTALDVYLPPDSGYPFVVGLSWDQASNRTKFYTFKLKDVTFVGKLCGMTPAST